MGASEAGARLEYEDSGESPIALAADRRVLLEWATFRAWLVFRPDSYGKSPVKEIHLRSTDSFVKNAPETAREFTSETESL